MARLLVLVPDYISAILKKGEYQPRYYNPGEVFSEVHILTTTPDRPELAALQRTVGSARVMLHNLPEDPGLVRGKWWWFDNYQLRRWAEPGVALAREIKPDLMRVHGIDFNSYVAARIKAALGIPFAASLHINPDINATRRHLRSNLTRDEKLNNALFDEIERESLDAADLVMPVYQCIIPYLERMGVRRYEVVYNVLNGEHLRRKDSYARNGRFRILSVGRLFEDKYPENIIRSVHAMPDAELTIVGDGPARAPLEALTAELGVGDRVRFLPAVANDELCASMPGYDVFAIHTEYWELNKSLLEALLTGLPCVVNRRRGLPVPELDGDFILKVENSVESYRGALERIASDDTFRAALGQRAYEHAQARWAPEKTEARVVEIYRRLLQASPHRGA